MLKIGIVGASGYSGVELVKLLLNHPEAELVKLYGHSSIGTKISDVHKSLRGLIDLQVEQFNKDDLKNLDLVFVALPSGEALKVVPQLYEAELKIIDLGGDYRLSNIDDYKKYYKHDHSSVDLLNAAVYGLSEWNSENIKNAKLVANPGCYPTSIQLALLPLMKNKIIKDEFVNIISYSGTSGAGKTISQNMLFAEVNESVRAYKVGVHQHIPEIKKYLEFFSGSNVNFSFVPHLLPATRGIYSTISVNLKNADIKSINNAFENEYSNSPFIRLYHSEIPELKDVVNTNFCDIGWIVDENKTIVLFSAIDNLIKGAAGQAVQNMNIMFGFDQTLGLIKCTEKKW